MKEISKLVHITLKRDDAIYIFSYSAVCTVSLVAVHVEKRFTVWKTFAKFSKYTSKPTSQTYI